MENDIIVQIHLKIVLCCVGENLWLASLADERILFFSLVVAVSGSHY